MVVKLTEAEKKALKGEWLSSKEYARDTPNIGAQFFECSLSESKYNPTAKWRIKPYFLDGLVHDLAIKRFGVEGIEYD